MQAINASMLNAWTESTPTSVFVILDGKAATAIKVSNFFQNLGYDDP